MPFVTIASSIFCRRCIVCHNIYLPVNVSIAIGSVEIVMFSAGGSSGRGARWVETEGWTIRILMYWDWCCNFKKSVGVVRELHVELSGNRWHCCGLICLNCGRLEIPTNNCFWFAKNLIWCNLMSLLIRLFQGNKNWLLVLLLFDKSLLIRIM